MLKKAGMDIMNRTEDENTYRNICIGIVMIKREKTMRS